MKLHFRNLEYVTPPGTLVDILPHPFYAESLSIEVALFQEHRFAFFFWNKWTQQLFKNKNIKTPPCLVTIDWHQDLVYPEDIKKQWLAELNISNNQDVALFSWANLSNINDEQIIAAAYLNLVGNVYVHCRQGTLKSDWEDENFTDKYGNIHIIRKYKKFEDLENFLIKSNEEEVYFDIDLDFFTISNPLNGKGKNFTFMRNADIIDMLKPNRPLINWIFKRLKGFTIATEPEHSGGLKKSIKFLGLIDSLYFKPTLFSNYGEQWDRHTNWKHLY